MGGFGILRIVEQDIAIRVKRRSVVEQHSGFGGQSTHQPIPHHPAAGGEEEQFVPSVQIRVQQMLFCVLQQGAASAVNDALGFTRGTGTEHDVKRMIKRQLFKLDLFIC